MAFCISVPNFVQILNAWQSYDVISIIKEIGVEEHDDDVRF